MKIRSLLQVTSLAAVVAVMPLPAQDQPPPPAIPPFEDGPPVRKAGSTKLTPRFVTQISVYEDGTMEVPPMTLMDFLTDLECYMPMGKPSLVPGWVMPNIMMDGETGKCSTSARMRLSSVTPLQALTLAASAANCVLLPVHGPAGDASVPADPAMGALPSGTTGTIAVPNQPHIIAYRIVPIAQAAEATKLDDSAESDHVSGIGIALRQNGARAEIGAILPGTPAARTGEMAVGDVLVSVRDESGPETPTDGLDLKKVAMLIRGAAGSPVHLVLLRKSDKGEEKKNVTVIRENMRMAHSTHTLLPAAPGFTPVTPTPTYIAIEPAPGHPSFNVTAPRALPPVVLPTPSFTVNALTTTGAPPSGPPAQPPASETPAVAPPLQTIRIYGVALMLREPADPDPARAEAIQERNYKDLQDLISSALDTAGTTSSPPPKISLHAATGTLIVKATAAEHDIIAQVIAALKENQAAPAPERASKVGP